METETIQVNDIVAIKAEYFVPCNPSCYMTVTSICDGRIFCTYLHGKEIREEVFYPEALTIIERNSPDQFEKTYSTEKTCETVDISDYFQNDLKTLCKQEKKVTVVPFVQREETWRDRSPML